VSGQSEVTKRSSRKTHRFLWITDPWETLDHARDTTLRLAQEALSLGHESFWCDVRSIRLETSSVVLEASPLSEKAREGMRPFPSQVRSPSDFSSLHYRVDPPVDLAYLHPLQLLVLSGARIVNPPKTLFGHNEKTEAALVEELMPESLVSSQWNELQKFGKGQQKTVLKPMHQAQSKGVELLSWNTASDLENNKTILSLSTEQFSRPVLLQRYLKEIEAGEQRLWFLDGKLLACAKKMPLHGDFRVNIDGGSQLKKTVLSDSEKKSARVIGKFLRKQGIRLAAIDLIGGYVTDFNFTSPGLITQMESVLGENLAKPIIRALIRA
jgi:glutathione synthase